MLLPGVDEWMDAFFELSTDRGGNHLAPIPSSSISAWAAIHVDGSEHDAFRRAMRAADHAWLTKKRERDQEEQQT